MIRRTLKKLQCFFGYHSWRFKGSYVTGSIATQRRVKWRCIRCGKKIDVPVPHDWTPPGKGELP